MATQTIHIPDDIVNHCAALVADCLDGGAVRDPAVFAYAVDAVALLPHALALRATTPVEEWARDLLVNRTREIVRGPAEGEGRLCVVAERVEAARVAEEAGLADAAELLLVMLPPDWVWLVIVCPEEEPVATTVVPIRLPGKDGGEDELEQDR
jgi:hypothetical protein